LAAEIRNTNELAMKKNIRAFVSSDTSFIVEIHKSRSHLGRGPIVRQLLQQASQINNRHWTMAWTKKLSYQELESQLRDAQGTIAEQDKTIELLNTRVNLIQTSGTGALGDSIDLLPQETPLEPEKAIAAFENITSGVDRWLDMWIAPSIRSSATRNVVLDRATTASRSELTTFKDWTDRYPEYLEFCKIPGVEHRALWALIHRVLHLRIFQPVLYEINREAENIIESLVKIMLEDWGLKARETMVRSWFCLAVRALMNAPRFASGREVRIDRIVEEIVRLVSIFVEPDKKADLANSAEKLFVRPAIEFQEDIARTYSLHYAITYNDYIKEPVNPEVRLWHTTDPSFYKELDTMRLVDTSNKGAVIKFNTMAPQPNEDYIKQSLEKHCVSRPALSVRKLGVERELQCLVEQQVEVSYQRKMTEDATLMGDLYEVAQVCAQLTKQSAPAEHH
jgi:hypothetical protein